MVDRVARDKMAHAIEAYMNEETTSFEIDTSVWGVPESTSDAAVLHVANEMRYYYADYRDYHIVISKNDWDYVYRLVLLLRSSAEVTATETKHVSLFRHTTAIICLEVSPIFWTVAK